MFNGRSGPEHMCAYVRMYVGVCVVKSKAHTKLGNFPFQETYKPDGVRLPSKCFNDFLKISWPKKNYE